MGFENLFVKQVDDGVVDLLRRIHRISEQEKHLKKEKDLLKKDLLSLVGDAEDFIDDNGEEIATYRMSKPVTKFNKELFVAENPALYEKYVYEDIGIRRLVFNKDYRW